MLEILTDPEFRIIVGISAVLIAVVIAVYVVLKIRGHAEQDMPGTADYLTNFREMYERGALGEDEFRRLKSELSEAVQRELNEDSADRDQAHLRPTGETESRGPRGL